MQPRLILMMLTAIIVTCLSGAGAVMAQSEKEITNSIGMKLVLIPKGTFQMGSPETEEGRSTDEVQHQVTLSKDFYFGVTEVTQVQYQKVMGDNPSYFQGDKVQGQSSRHPVEQVSWEDAVEFCKKLSALPEEQKAGREYRLPNEAEWEYACRAGSKKSFGIDWRFDSYFGEQLRSLDDYAWFSLNSEDKTHPVGEKKPNAWGLYDMHGNVWEWCSDWYDEYPKGAASDPAGPREGSNRVNCGGCWNFEAAFCRSAFRFWINPSIRTYFIGFRVALSSSGITK